MLSWIGAPSATWDAVEASAFAGAYRVVLERDRARHPRRTGGSDSSDTDANDAQLRAVAGRGWAGGRLQVGVDVHSRFDLSSESPHRLRRRRVDGHASTSAAAIEEARQLFVGLFATWSRALAPRWTLAVGARGDSVESRNRGGFFGDSSTSDAALSATCRSPGRRRRLERHRPGARGYRSPTLSDRYFRVRRDAAS